MGEAGGLAWLPDAGAAPHLLVVGGDGSLSLRRTTSRPGPELTPPTPPPAYPAPWYAFAVRSNGRRW